MENPVFSDYDYDPNLGEVEYLEYSDENRVDYDIPDLNAWKPDEKEEEIPPMSFGELYEYCVIPTLSDSFVHLYTLVLWCLLFTLSTRVVKLPTWLVHLTSCGCGSVVLWQLFGLRTYYMAALIGFGLTSLIVANFVMKSFRGPITCLVCILYLLFCELWLADASDWHSIRGSQMVLLMKVVSVGFDVDSGKLTSLPHFLELLGYLLNPGNVVFGPWVSMETYREVTKPFRFSLHWFMNVLSKLAISMLCLVMSTCVTTWVIPNSANRWALAYREALSFRSSHYFVSYFSETSLLVAGISAGPVVNPVVVEMPRSLVEVVIGWNMPMHYWLKTYIFSWARKAMGPSIGILLTYLVSALFHGLNFQLSAVLLSLGAYTYIEYSLRAKLAHICDACIMARSCAAKCSHKHKGPSARTRTFNLAAGLLSVFHLAYLGVMFDSTSQQQESGYSIFHTLAKWNSLGFISHWIAFACHTINAIL